MTGMSSAVTWVSPRKENKPEAQNQRRNLEDALEPRHGLRAAYEVKDAAFPSKSQCRGKRGPADRKTPVWCPEINSKRCSRFPWRKSLKSEENKKVWMDGTARCVYGREASMSRAPRLPVPSRSPCGSGRDSSSICRDSQAGVEIHAEEQRNVPPSAGQEIC